MHLLLDLPMELLRKIVDCVAPNDLDNLMLCDERLREAASLHPNLLLQHEIDKVQFKRIGTSSTRYQYQESLEMFLWEPSKAEYVKEMIVTPWKLWFNVYSAFGERAAPFFGLRGSDEGHPRYPDPMMKAFEEAVKTSKSIPLEEKEQWILKIEMGNQNPIIALLLPQLDYLTYLEMILGNREDLFLLKTLQRIVKDGCSPSLSRLRQIKVLGSSCLTHRLELATACVALTSIVSVRAQGLVEGPLDSAEPVYEMFPRSSCVRDIEIHDCRFSRDTLRNLIRAVKSKSLRSFKYSDSGSRTDQAFAWVYAALFQFSSKSLEELSLRRSHLVPLYNMEFDFKRFRKLRVLAIDYGLLMGNKFELTKKVVNFLPTSLEILDLYPCSRYFFEWISDLVDALVRAKGKKLPCLKELNYKPTSTFLGRSDTGERFEEMCAMAAEAGFKMTVTFERPTSWY